MGNAVFQSLLHMPLQADRLVAWHPNGHLLSGVKQGQAFLLDARTSHVEDKPFFALGPWSPNGEQLLAQDEAGQTLVLSWPDLHVIARLSALPWQWAGNQRLVALSPTGVVWREAPFDQEERLEESENPWLLLHPVEDKAVGIRWRSGLKRHELVFWKPGFALDVATRPDLANLRFEEWAWAPHNEGWACLENHGDPSIRAWSHPLGHAQAEVRRERNAGGLVHAGAALLWLSPGEVRGWSFASQEHHAHAFPSYAKAHDRAWHAGQRHLAVAGPDGVEILAVNPEG